ncbi:MAG: DUF4055 domain-containing protein, partial [Planctomycetaceae bacterium]|nr:DUF4055 domain-containing protein [Planctomycetaceae bacterium]
MSFTQKFAASKYKELVPFWERADDCYEGSIRIREKQQEYLPPLESERDANGHLSFQWKTRFNLACFKNLLRPTVDDIVGIMQRNPANIRFDVAERAETPQEVKDIEIYGNAHNDGLLGLKRRLNHAQVLFGRAGLLLDVEAEQVEHGIGGIHPRFVIKEYPAKTILDGEVTTPVPGEKARLKWVLLNESTSVYDPAGKQWTARGKYRVLGVAHGSYYTCVIEGDSQECVDRWKAFDFDNPPPDAIYPVFKGTTLPMIPFTVCNVNRLGINEWQNPPFYDVVEATLKRYQLSSIYHLGLYRHASPTLVLANAKPRSEKMTLGGVLSIESGNGGVPASAHLMETSGAGFNEMRSAMEEAENVMRYVSLRSLLDGAGANSSGEAIAMRAASGTASIADIDTSGARAIEEQLIFAAIWAGASAQ